MQERDLLKQKNDNDRKKELSEQALDENSEQLGQLINTLENSRRLFPTIERDYGHDFRVAALIRDEEDLEIRKTVARMDPAQVGAETRLAELNHRTLANDVEFSRVLNDIQERALGLSPRDRDTIQRIDDMLAINRTLTDEHVNNVSQGLEIDERIKQQQENNPESRDESASLGPTSGGPTGGEATAGGGPHAGEAASGGPTSRELANNENTGSLIDDFADPNLDQPSHMNPED